jgi:periplasmic protein CpxP/Spy
MKALQLARATSALVLTTILAGGVGTTAFAQTTPAANPPAASAPADTTSSGTTPSGSTAGTSTTAHHPMMNHARHAASRTPGETMEQMAEQRISDLHTRLHITAAQQSQWDQFAQVMRDNAKDLDQAYAQRAATFEKMNAVENMQSYAQIEQTRAQDVQKLGPAFQALYTSMSDEQKQQADRVFRNQAARATQRHAASAAH